VQQGQAIAQIVLDREELSEKVTAAMAQHEELGSVRADYEQARAALGQRDAELRVIRSKIEEDGQSLTELAVRARELSLALEHLVDQVGERHRVTLHKVLGDYHDRELPDPSVESRIDELFRLIERMG